MSGLALRPNCSFCCWGSPKPLISELKILPELFRKVLAFIRFDDYNYTVNAGVSPPAVFRFCAARGASPVLSALARSGGFQRTRRSRRTQESRTASISRSPPKTKNEPQIISATLTRNNGVYSISRVRMDALTPCHESTQIVDSTDYSRVLQRSNDYEQTTACQ